MISRIIFLLVYLVNCVNYVYLVNCVNYVYLVNCVNYVYLVNCVNYETVMILNIDPCEIPLTF